MQKSSKLLNKLSQTLHHQNRAWLKLLSCGMWTFSKLKAPPKKMTICPRDLLLIVDVTSTLQGPDVILTSEVKASPYRSGFHVGDGISMFDDVKLWSGPFLF